MKTKILAAQIDLARRKENLPEIKRFIDHLSSSGFNTLFLYLEDRIKTKSYPYPSDRESYTPDEMRELVAYATSKNIELIPSVSNHSHTERFLRFEELLPMAELYGNIKGRFNKAGEAYYNLTCLSNPKTYEFFDKYMAEIADIFPSPYFNAGLDESFDIASCKKCRERFLRDGSLAPQLAEHITHTRDLLHSLGKKMMMFDDMLYISKDLLELIPRDVIMLSWNYEYINRLPGGQFENTERRDLFREYDRLGISYIPASWTNMEYNIDTLTAYAERYNPIGHLVTTWQMNYEPLITNYVNLAYAALTFDGVLKNNPYERLKAAVRKTVGEDLPEHAVSALALAASKSYANRPPRNFYFANGAVVRRNVNFDAESKLDLHLRDALSAVPDGDLKELLLFRLDSAARHYELLSLTERLFDIRSGALSEDPKQIAEQFRALRSSVLLEKAAYGRFWEKYREGIEEDYSEDIELMLSDIDRLAAEADAAAFNDSAALDMTLLLPDKSTRSVITLTAEFSDGTEETLARGTFKPYLSACYNISEKGPYVYTVTFLTKPTPIKTLCISVSGFGSTNLVHLANIIEGEAKAPTEIVSTFGRVYAPERVLTANTLSAELGEGDMLLPFRDPDQADLEHGITVAF